MANELIDSPNVWQAETLRGDQSWIFELSDGARRDLVSTVDAIYDPERPLLDYRLGEADLDSAWPTIEAAVREAYFGCGVAIVKGLPRAALDESRFGLLSWCIGLRIGVARPQGKATQYLSDVRDAGVNYRASTGRGFSSNAGLDFHADGADLTTLACYNAAQSGGQSLITSSSAAWNRLVQTQPELSDVLREPYSFSRQGEQAADETAHYAQPVVDFADGRLFMKWNRNRIQSAQKLEGAPPLSDAQYDAVEALDAIVRSPEFAYTMYLEPGDLQIMNNLDILHSRTEFIDHEAPEAKRLLHRLWLAPPNSVRMPDSWIKFYRSVKPGTVRGGIRGHQYDASCQAFDARQATAHDMTIIDHPDGAI
ncbi:MAG: TauD/TfdA family dioxygenase [Pseudomonadota bacterium]